jgi:hypothetical protein
MRYLIEMSRYRRVRNSELEIHMHPSLSNMIINVHVRDLHRAMHPDRSKRQWRNRLARVRQSR